MYSLLRLYLGLVFLAPALAHAQSALDIPGDGDTLSGIGVISGWKCEAQGGHHDPPRRRRPDSCDVWVSTRRYHISVWR